MIYVALYHYQSEATVEMATLNKQQMIDKLKEIIIEQRGYAKYFNKSMTNNTPTPISLLIYEEGMCKNGHGASRISEWEKILDHKFEFEEVYKI